MSSNQETKSTGSKKSKVAKQEQPVQPVADVPPVVAEVPAVVAEVPVAPKKQKKAPVQPVVTPVVEQVVAPLVEEPATPAQSPIETKKKQIRKQKEPVSEQSHDTVETQTVSQTPQEGGALANPEEEEKPGKRYFKCMYGGADASFGRLCGVKPKQAANKAFTSILRHMKKNNIEYTMNTELHFTIKECTRGGKGGEYSYYGIRQLLEKPVEVTINIYDPKDKDLDKKQRRKVAEKIVLYKNKNVVRKVVVEQVNDKPAA